MTSLAASSALLHRFTRVAYIGGAASPPHPGDSPWAGKHRSVAACVRSGCLVFQHANGTIANLDSTTTAASAGCKGELLPDELRAPPTHSPKRARHHKKTKSPRRRSRVEIKDDDQSDESDLLSDSDSSSNDSKLSCDDMDLDMIIKTPIDLIRIARAIASGSKCWLGDAFVAPSTLNIAPHGVTPAEPSIVLRCKSILERIIAARILITLWATGDITLLKPISPAQPSQPSQSSSASAASAASAGPAARDAADNRDEPHDAVRIDWQQIAGMSAQALTMSAAFALEVVIVFMLASLGRDAEAFRLTLRPDEKDVDIRIRDPMNRDVFITWRQARRREKADEEVSSVEAMHSKPDQALLTIDAALKYNQNFRIGLYIVYVGFCPDRSAREVWRALDKASNASRRRIAREHPDEVLAAKRAAKAAAAAAAVRKPPPKRAPRGPGKGSGDAKGEKITNTPARNRAEILKAEPKNRSNTECHRAGLCKNCREPGHLKADCKNTPVVYVGR